MCVSQYWSISPRLPLDMEGRVLRSRHRQAPTASIPQAVGSAPGVNAAAVAAAVASANPGDASSMHDTFPMMHATPDEEIREQVCPGAFHRTCGTSVEGCCS